MSSTQEFRRRIKSANNTKQITKAMEMIASVKMQKAVKTAENSRQYVQNAWNFLERLSGFVLPKDHPLVQKRSGAKTAVIFITSDRGLCGSYNAELIKKLISFNENCPPAGGLKMENSASAVDVIAVGKIGANFIQKTGTGNLVAEFPFLETGFDIANVTPIVKLTVDEFLNKKYDRVVAIYSHFESSLKQTPVIKQILPISDEHIDKPELWVEKKPSDSVYRFEPDAAKIFDAVLRQILEVQILGAILEANASRHSAQMIAMKNATDNASDLISELQLIYNTIRQNNITSEIAEISGAAEAMA